MSTAEKVTHVEGKFLYLLIALFSVFVIYPFVQHKPIGTIVFDILLLAMLVAGIYTVVDKKILLIIALLLAIPFFWWALGQLFLYGSGVARNRLQFWCDVLFV